MAIAKGARQRGARMEQNCEVTRLQPRTDGRWDVVTEKVHNPIWTGHGDLLPTELFSDLTLKMFKKSILNPSYGVLAHTLIYITVLASQVSDFVLLIITN